MHSSIPLPKWPVLLVIVACSTQAAEEDAAITGHVIDEATRAPLEGTQVVITGTGRGTMSDSRGRFTFHDLPPGTHTLLVRRIGYQSVHMLVQVTTEGSTVVEVAMPLPERWVPCRDAVAEGVQERSDLTRRYASTTDSVAVAMRLRSSSSADGAETRIWAGWGLEPVSSLLRVRIGDSVLGEIIHWWSGNTEYADDLRARYVDRAICAELLDVAGRWFCRMPLSRDSAVAIHRQLYAAGLGQVPDFQDLPPEVPPHCLENVLIIDDGIHLFLEVPGPGGARRFGDHLASARVEDVAPGLSDVIWAIFRPSVIRP